MAIGTADTKVVTGYSAANTKQFQAVFNKIIAVRVTLAETSLGAGLASAAVYTVPGAALGDFVLVAPISDLGDDISFTAQVTAANEVTVILQDQTEATNTSAATAGNVNIVVLGVDAGMFNNAGSF